MKFKGTLILFIIVLFAGVYIYFYEIQGEESRQKEKELTEKVFHFPMEDVKEIHLKNIYGEMKFVKQADSGWQITEPVNYKCDENVIEDFLIFVVNTKYEGVADESNDNLKNFGLEEPKIEIKLVLADGESRSLHLGDKNPLGTQVYSISRKDSFVVLLRNSVYDKSKNELFHYRDKRIVTFETSHINNITYRTGKRKLVLNRLESGNWEIESPIKSKADKSEIEKILKQLKEGKVKNFYDNKAGKITEYGLNKPIVKIDFLTGINNEHHQLLIGKSLKNTVFIKDPQREPVFEIEKLLEKSILPNLFALRDKKMTAFDRDAVNEFDLVYPGLKISCLRASTGDWNVTSPRKAKGKNWKVAAVISDLDLIRAEGFVEGEKIVKSRYGLDKPKMEIIIKQNSKVVEHLVLGKIKNEQIYFYNKTLNKLYVTNKNILQKLTYKVEDLAEKL